MNITNTYATVWEVLSREYPARIRLSTSRKDRDNNYVNSNWFGALFGEAFNKVGLLPTQERCRIKITNATVERVSVKQEDGSYKNYVNLTIFDFEPAEEFNKNAPPQSRPQKYQNADLPEEDDSEDYPF